MDAKADVPTLINNDPSLGHPIDHTGMNRHLLKRLLQATAVSLLLANGIMLLRGLSAGRDIGLSAVYLLLLLAAFVLLKANRLKWLAHGFTAVFWLSITLYLLLLGIGGVPNPSAYTIAILTALLLLRGRTTFIYAMVSLIASILLMIGNQTGELPLVTMPNNPTIAMQHFPQAFLTYSLIAIAFFNLRYILATLHFNEQALQQIQATLGQRTTDLSVSNAQLRQEIHEREQAEARLEQQRAFLRQIIDTIPNFVFVKDSNGRYLITNKALADAYKTTPTMLEGLTLGEFNHNQQEVARFEEGDHQVLATQEEVFWPELFFTDLDGNKHWLQVVKRPLFDPTTGTTNVLGISTDITLEKTITESLREKEENFRTLVEASFEGIIICVNQIIQEANINFAHMFGYTAVADVMGKNAEQFLTTDDIEALQTQLVGNPKTIMEAVGIRQDNTTFPVELVTHTINFQGQVAQITGYRDITTRKQAEEAEQHARKLESLSLMAGGLAHDFNNLLVAMMGQMAIAKAKIEPEHSSQNNLDKAIQATETAAMLTRQLLAYTGQGHFEVTTIHLNQLIAQNLQLFQDALPPNISFQTNLHDPLPPILADGVQIQQIIMNLLLNAAEALGTQPGTITINTTPCHLDAGQLPHWQQHNEAITPGEFVLLEVSDTGRGMDEATLNRIFDPFFSTKGTGRGLGLAAVMGIVRGHRGSVRASSRLGHGTTFQFLFPSEKANSSEMGTAVPQPTPQQNTVLIIDDERQVREAMRDILDLQAIPTLTAASGQEGIDQFTVHQDKIGLIILDLSMPGMSGIEAFAALRQVNPTAKIILSSGYTETEILEKMAGTRPTGFLQKPYRLDKVLSTVSQFLS